MNQTLPTSGTISGSVTTPLPARDFPGLSATASAHSTEASKTAHPAHPGQPGQPAVRVQDLSKIYTGNTSSRRGDLTLFDGLELTIWKGEMVAIVGQSGSGKSTLLHMLGALDAPTSGTIYFASTQVNHLTTHEAARFRNEQIGYVWQFHYLLPEFTAQENVAMPLLARGLSRREAMREAAVWMNETGLADRADHRPGELSGGEQQRVALARALVTKPQILLADEPTGDLDDASADMVFSLIQRLHKAYGLTSVLVTHNMDLAGRCTRTLRLAGGRLTEVSNNPLNNLDQTEAFTEPHNSR